LTSFGIVVIVALLAGLLLVGASSAMLHSADRKPTAPKWPALVDESLTRTDARQRKEMAERLALLGTPWSRHVLERAAREETDASVRSAIRSAMASCESISP
jgi:HEAT repeat protein